MKARKEERRDEEGNDDKQKETKLHEHYVQERIYIYFSKITNDRVMMAHKKQFHFLI
eukprot:m.4241 g.4241  ORF g.4241 m.4241 type:complete len:57 (+) comp3304_c0_seq1:75-245(+)